MEAVTAAAAEEEDRTGTARPIIVAITTPVATIKGMTTYGLDIVVKSNAFLCFGRWNDVSRLLIHVLPSPHRPFFLCIILNTSTNICPDLEAAQAATPAAEEVAVDMAEGHPT